MIDSKMQTIDGVKRQEDDAPVLVAMVTHSSLNSFSTGISHETSITLDDAGFTRIALVLVLSFISIVTISRRPSQN